MSLALERGSAHETQFFFGPFTVDAAKRSVYKNGSPLRLTLKCVELLVALLRNAGRTLSKEDLLQAAWHDTSPSDATLAQHIFLLRRALEPHGEWIETVPHTGYRFREGIRVERRGGDATLEEYARGAAAFRSLQTEQGLRSAIELYGRIIAADSSSAGAYAGRAACNRLLAQYMYAEPMACLAAASRDAALAFTWEPENLEVLLECAYSAALFDRDGRRAQAFLSRAQILQRDRFEVIELQVSLALLRGDLDAALQALPQPRGPLHGALLYLAGDYAHARAELEQRAEDPLARLLVSACRFFEGDAAGARRGLSAIYHQAVDVRRAGQPNVRHYALAMLIYVCARSGEQAAARRGALNLARLARERFVSPMARAVAHTGLREYDAAVSFVEEAVLRVDPWTAHLSVNPFLDDLRGDERFERLTRIVAGNA